MWTDVDAIAGDRPEATSTEDDVSLWTRERDVESRPRAGGQPGCAPVAHAEGAIDKLSGESGERHGDKLVE